MPRDDIGALLRLVAAPAAPDDQCFAHSQFLRQMICVAAQSSSPWRDRRGSMAGRSGRLSMSTCRPASDERWNASITSSTWKASSPLARCGRPGADGVRHVGDADDADSCRRRRRARSAPRASRSVGGGDLDLRRRTSSGRAPPSRPRCRRARSAGGGGAATSKLIAIVTTRRRRTPACRRHGSRPRPGSVVPFERLAGDRPLGPQRATVTPATRFTGPSRLTRSVM